MAHAFLAAGLTSIGRSQPHSDPNPSNVSSVSSAQVLGNLSLVQMSPPWNMSLTRRSQGCVQSRTRHPEDVARSSRQRSALMAKAADAHGATRAYNLKC